MKKLASTALVAAMLLGLNAAPSFAGFADTGFWADAGQDVIYRRGRGADDNGDDDETSGSGRDKPRIPGGSGCDDPEDLIEHPECAG